MVYIGDSSVDEAASRQAGVPFVAYRNPALTADAHINDLGQIISLFCEPYSVGFACP